MSSTKPVERSAESFMDQLLGGWSGFDLFNEKKTEKVKETGGVVFPNGRCIELCRHQTGQLTSLVLLDSTDNTLHQRIEYEGQTYVPPIIHPSLMEALRLPTRGSRDSTVNNFKHICTLFMERSVSQQAAKKLTYWVFSTWFADLFPVAPYLILTGSQPEASLVLQLLTCAVRHGLSLADISMSGFRFLPMHIQPTLLINHLSPAGLKVLSISNYPNAYLPTQGGFADLYCAKAVYGGTRLSDAALGSALRVHLDSPHGKLPVISDFEQRRLAEDLQSRLVDYRIMHAGHVRDSDFDVPALGSELRLLARVLGSAIVDAPELRADLVKLLQQYEDEIAAVNIFNDQSIVVEALLAHSHSNQSDHSVYVGQLADTSNSLLKERGSREKLEPKALGWIVRNELGFSPKRNAKGFAIKLTEDVRRRIHQLARDLQILVPDEVLGNCTLCAEMLGSESAEVKLELGAKTQDKPTL